VSSTAGLLAMRAEWDALWASIPDRTPFQSSAWLLPWWAVFGTAEPRVFVFRDRGRLVGLAPMYQTRAAAGREMRLIGAGISDYLDVLAAPGAERAVSEALCEALASSREWDACYLDHLRPGSPLVSMSTPGQATRDGRGDEEPCPVLALPPSLPLREVLGGHVVKELRYCWRRADRLGTAAIERATDESVQRMLTALFDLHDARWASKGSAGVLSTEPVRAFHRAAAPALFSAGLLRMHALTVGGRTAAVYYGLHAAHRAFFYIGGFDPTFSPISPGKLAIFAALEQGVEEGATAFDFLGGREGYKYEWNAIDQPRFNRYFSRNHQDVNPAPLPVNR
jgi:CelD/BcsL family acetyltransferase involved in cellulose biosynthesis